MRLCDSPREEGNDVCDWFFFRGIAVLGMVWDLRVERFGLQMVRLGFWKREVWSVRLGGGSSLCGWSISYYAFSRI